MVVLDFFLSLALQMLFTIGFIFIFGKLLALCNARFYKNFGPYGKHVCYITGFIGTPVHEGCHALMCLLFRHKILEIKLFQPDAQDGTLGYVKHSYNPQSRYQKVGNLFIGIAPVLLGALILALLLYALLPELFSDVISKLNGADFLSDFGRSLGNIFAAFALMFSYAVKWQWWVFVLIGSFLALHMTLSRADVKGALLGLVLYIAAFAITDVALLIAGGQLLPYFTSGVVACGTFLLFFFCLFLIIAVLLTLISYIFAFARSKRLAKKIKARKRGNNPVNNRVYVRGGNRSGENEDENGGEQEF